LNDRELHTGKDASASEHQILKGFAEVQVPDHDTAMKMNGQLCSTVEEIMVNFTLEAEWVHKVIWVLWPSEYSRLTQHMNPSCLLCLMYLQDTATFNYSV
jgi:hypothetical protein